MKKERKKSTFFKEFKEFISKGSVIDLAVGVVVGGAFTAIVNALVGSILTPLINWVIFLCCGGNTEAFANLDVVLIPAVLDEAGVVVKEATVLGFSNLITAALNFLLIAFTLFCIIRVINKVRRDAEEAQKKLAEKAKARKSKANPEETSEEAPAEEAPAEEEAK